jgi:hypothetical protein
VVRSERLIDRPIPAANRLDEAFGLDDAFQSVTVKLFFIGYPWERKIVVRS